MERFGLRCRPRSGCPLNISAPEYAPQAHKLALLGRSARPQHRARSDGSARPGSSARGIARPSPPHVATRDPRQEIASPITIDRIEAEPAHGIASVFVPVAGKHSDTRRGVTEV